MSTEDALRDVFIASRPEDEIGGGRNVVHALDDFALAVKTVADAITPRNAAGNRDAAGGHVESLTEAAMGITKALVQIAGAISDLANAVREKGE